MRVGSLFSGIGGLDLGLERAGMEIVWQVENNDFCQKVLKKHWPEVPCYGDIKEVDFTKLAPVDLICGGFPCQPWSMAGHRKGINDDRNLWPETIRAVREVMPRWCLFENVPGLLTHRYFGRIIGDLAESGYIVEWDCLPTGICHGHRRDRVFIVAHLNITGLSCNWECSTTKGTKESEFVQPTPPCFPGPKPAPPMVRNVHGIPRRMDRIKALGNAVVPQVSEWIGRRIMEVISEDATLL